MQIYIAEYIAAYHVMLNSVSEKSEWSEAAISQFVDVGRAEYLNFVKQSRIDLILQFTKFMFLSCCSACVARQ